MATKLGMVLSGGGVRGMAHIGLLQALKENGIRPSVISGSSAGALVGALCAAGYSSEDMIHFFKTTPVFKFSFYTAKKPGLMDSERYRVFFEKYFPVDSFSALNIPVHIAATDLVNAQFKIFNKGKLIQPLLASAAVPPIFTPVLIDGVFYSDGGVMNNFPTEPLVGRVDKIIGSFVSPVKQVNLRRLGSAMKVLHRSTDLALYAASQSKFNQCDLLFEPKELARFGMFDTKQIDYIFEIGYENAMKNMSRFKSLVDKGKAMKAIKVEAKYWNRFSLN